MKAVHTPALGRAVYLREGTSDAQVWADTYSGLYHVPPYEIDPATVLDLGANIGLTAAHYAALWPDAEIVAVEMDSDCAELARLNAPTVTVNDHAVSADGGWGSYDPAVRAEAFRFEPGDRDGQLKMSLTLRQIIKRSFPGGCVDFAKMDIEGAEWGILAKPTWAPLVCSLLVELHPVGDMPDDSDWLVSRAVDLLAAAGFEAKRFERHPRAVWATRT